MTRQTIERMHLIYSRTVTETDDDSDMPSLPPQPAATVVETDGERVSETTRPLAKCRNVIPFSRSLRRVV